MYSFFVNKIYSDICYNQYGEYSTMIDLLEDKRTEFKVKITDNLEKEVIAFLNTDGGNIYIGVDDKGNIQGNLGNIDLLQRTIKDKLKDNIMPSTLGLFDVIRCKQKNNYKEF